LAGLAANAACEKFRWKFFFGPMSLMGTPEFRWVMFPPHLPGSFRG
jgi:hypothetical protein